DLGRGLAQAPLVNVGQNDACAFFGAAACGGKADAGAGGSGDDHGFSVEKASPGRIGRGSAGPAHRSTRGSVGRPRARSPVRVFWISLEPAEIVSARENRNSRWSGGN